MALINLNDTTPAAPSGFQNTKWLADTSSPRNVSAYIPGTGGVVVKTADYTAAAADCGKLIVFNSSGAHALTMPAAAPFAQWNIGVQNIGTGVVTISPNGLNIDGAASSLTLTQTQGLGISTDATNYFTERGAGSGAVSSLTTTGSSGAATLTSGVLNIPNYSGGGGGMTLIASNVLTSSASSVTFSSIPGTYHNLQLMGNGRTSSGSIAEWCNVRFNGDTGGNYIDEIISALWNVTPSGSTSGNGATSVRMFALAGNGSTGGFQGTFNFFVPSYTQTSYYKLANGQGSYVQSGASGGVGTYTTAGHWLNSGAITSITLFCASGASFLAGSGFYLYGY